MEISSMVPVNQRPNWSLMPINRSCNKSLDLIEKLNGESKKPIITKRSAIWGLREKVEQVAEQKEGLKTKEDKIHLFEGFKVVFCYTDERVRIIHDEKPSREAIDEIKKHGFKWSRFNTAWQRKITGNAVWTLKQYLKDKTLIK